MKNLSLQKLNNLVVFTYIVLAFFAIPHLIDDFLFDIPEEFGLTNMQTQVLSGVFIVLFLVILVAAARGTRRGYGGTTFMGAFLALAVLLKHFPRMILPEPYWSGWFSETLIVGVFVSGIILVIISVMALRRGGGSSPE
jgi:hypothetical protein